MLEARTIVIVLIALVTGFVGGFVLRPAISPIYQTDVSGASSATGPVSSETRGTQYFVAHIDEARQVVMGCRNGAVRGGECATAEEAIIKVEAAKRRRKFLGN